MFLLQQQLLLNRKNALISLTYFFMGWHNFGCDQLEIFKARRYVKLYSFQALDSFLMVNERMNEK